MNTLKNKYDFESRLATKDEITALVEFLAEKNWQDSLKHKKPSRSKKSKLEAENFIKKEQLIIQELIGKKVLVQDYKKFEVSIFVYNYIEEHDKNTVTSLTNRILKTKKGMELLENEDILFNVKGLKNRKYHTKKVRSGRHSRPKNESIQKTLEIKNYIKTNPGLRMDDVCQKFGFSKTTYYRAIKWLEHRDN
ncbi:hypothetical protein [Aquimarina mytili]|uniref:Uncharacterized protein n=1 Tax=Aquimarina mytili TaxID=874423 RepID=A0A937D810_9FLAO|nr:hypothetical protein [Aquimarina mytili]MBL0683620.1 hypothetical protein [Aquimarina mytili]